MYVVFLVTVSDSELPRGGEAELHPIRVGQEAASVDAARGAVEGRAQDAHVAAEDLRKQR